MSGRNLQTKEAKTTDAPTRTILSFESTGCIVGRTAVNSCLPPGPDTTDHGRSVAETPWRGRRVIAAPILPAVTTAWVEEAM